MEEVLSPLRTVLDVAMKVAQRAGADNCTGYAAAAAYYFLFSLFPFLLFLMTLLAYLPVANLSAVIMDALSRILPDEVRRLLEDNVRELVAEQRGGLLSAGAALSLWSSSSAMGGLMDALNRVYRVPETRPFLLLQAQAVALVLLFSLFVLCATVLLVFGDRIGRVICRRLDRGKEVIPPLWNTARWGVIIVLTAAAVAGVYAFAPDLQAGWRGVVPGAIFSVAVWVPASLLFSWYVNRFGDYRKTYGSIGAVIALLTWLYVSSLILLAGGELNAVLLGKTYS